MMKSTLSAGLLATFLGGISIASQERQRVMPDVRIMTVDPGHFHAALVQKEMYPGVSERVATATRSCRTRCEGSTPG